MHVPALEFCPKCSKLTDFCNCDLQKLVSDLTLLEDTPEPCAICKKQDARKHGVCFDCLENYDLNEGKPVFVEEATLPESDIESQLQDVLAEENEDSYDEADDTDDWFSGDDEDFDDDPDETLEEDEDLSEKWDDDEDDDEEDEDEDEDEEEDDEDFDDNSGDDSEVIEDEDELEEEDFDDED